MFNTLRHLNLVYLIASCLLIITGCGGGDDGGGGGGDGGDSSSSGSTSPVVDLNQVLATSASLHTPIAVVDSDGNRTVAWKEGASYYMSRYESNTWQTAIPIFHGTYGISAFDIYASSQGNLIVAWAQYTSASLDGGILYVSQYTPATGWDTPVEIVTYDSHVTEVQVIDDGNGNATVVWAQREGPNFGYYNLWSSLKSTTTNWSTPEARESSTADVQNINLGIDGSSNVTIIWEQSSSLYFARYTIGWTPRTTLAATGSYVHADFNANGDIIAAWRQTDNFQYILYLRRFTASAGWDTPQAFTTIGNNVRYGPLVSINDAGDALVAWQFTGSFPNWDPLKAIRYTVGSGWGNIAGVDDNVFFDRIYNVNITNYNNGVIVRRDGNTSQVTYNYQETTGWDSKQTIYAVTDPDVVYNPSVAINTAGIGVITWAEKIGTDYQIRVRLY